MKISFCTLAPLFSCGLMEVPAQEPQTAVPAGEFLNSIGTLSAISVRGEKFEKTMECCKYLGIRWLRAGIEGSVPLSQFEQLHKEAGLMFSWGFGSGSADLPKLLQTGKQIAALDALLAFEGPNEPNNWAITYQGLKGGGNGSWLPVANLMKDLYTAVKSDPALKKYPVWSITEGGAQTDNVGLQFLTIPPGADTLLPPGTKFADFANVHNYIYHPASSQLADNKTWDAADPASACKVDGLYCEYGLTWGKHFRGYSEAELQKLPRVTTETGTTIGGEITEEIHALNLMSMYLDQFKRGWSYTAVYLLRDRVDEGGNQKFAFFKPDYSPRKAAVYLHNLTTILHDRGTIKHPTTLTWSIPGRPATTHDLLLQKSDGTLELLVWGERLKGSDELKVELGHEFEKVLVYDPTTGTNALQTLTKTRSVPLTLRDHPYVLEFPRK